eukprot:jgi/Botrbrau1/3616/Bobra.0204s0012.2
MEPVDVAKSLATYVEITGPDPKHVKATSSDFFKTSSGSTTLSASGLLVPCQKREGKSVLVLCPAPLLFPFLRADVRQADLASAGNDSLLAATRIRVGLGDASGELLEARLEGMFQVEGAAEAVASLAWGSWQQGWGLSSGTPAGHRWDSPAAPFLAVLRLPPITPTPGIRELLNRSAQGIEGWGSSGEVCGSTERGRPSSEAGVPQGTGIVAVGSPFGALSPQHFEAAVFRGSIANSVRQGGKDALLLVDVRCCPGMEGCPLISNPGGRLLGILTAPICNPLFNAEVPLAFCAARAAASFASWHTRWASKPEHLSPSMGGAAVQVPRPALHVPPAARTSRPLDGRAGIPKPWERSGATRTARPEPLLATALVPARASAPDLATALVLARASVPGLATGLVPAQASAPDLATPTGTRAETSLRQLCMARAVSATRSSVVAVMAANGSWATGVVMSSDGLILTNAHLVHPRGAAGAPTPSNAEDRGGAANRSMPLVRVQLPAGGAAQPLWVAGQVVYIFMGPLDLAVVQLLKQPPADVLPIVLEAEEPREGQLVGVVGYPLFNPSQGLGPWVTSGSIVRLVRETRQATSAPVMLLTSAAVHAGASGAAVVDVDGKMVGLVTSNARHTASQRLVQHLNFALPMHQLLPVFHWASQPPSSRTVSSLATLDVASPAVARVWSLVGIPNELPVEGREAGKAPLPTQLQRLLGDPVTRKQTHTRASSHVVDAAPLCISRL